MKNVLITGIGGFVGKHLARHLLSKNNYTITGTYHSDTGLPQFNDIQDKITLVKIDLQDSAAVNDLILKHKPDVIFHLAAQTSPAESFKNPAYTLTNNIICELNILEFLKNNKLTTRLIIISTSETYGLIKPEDLPVDELTQLRPANPYAVSKIAQDYLALQYFLSYKVDVVRLRPFNHIGPGQSDKFVVSSFAKQIAQIEKGQKDPVMKVGNLEAKRDFTDVRDVVGAYEFAVGKAASGEAYNIGQGRSHAIREILDILLTNATKKIAVEQDPTLIRPVDLPDVVCDATKFSIMTGWKPEIPVERTVKDILDYWRSLV